MHIILYVYIYIYIIIIFKYFSIIFLWSYYTYAYILVFLLNINLFKLKQILFQINCNVVQILNFKKWFILINDFVVSSLMILITIIIVFELIYFITIFDNSFKKIRFVLQLMKIMIISFIMQICI